MRFPAFFAVCVITNIGIKSEIFVATNLANTNKGVDLIVR